VLSKTEKVKSKHWPGAPSTTKFMEDNVIRGGVLNLFIEKPARDEGVLRRD
jgi:hypothetical protein